MMALNCMRKSPQITFKSTPNQKITVISKPQFQKRFVSDSKMIALYEQRNDLNKLTNEMTDVKKFLNIVIENVNVLNALGLIHIEKITKLEDKIKEMEVIEVMKEKN